MRVLVDGGWNEQSLVIYRGMEACHATYGITELLHAPYGNRADWLASEWCRRRRIKVVTADAKAWGGMRKPRVAAPIRNAAMIAMKPDILLVFQYGTGLMDMMRRARAAGIKIVKVNFS